jgi:hypothetical protein
MCHYAECRGAAQTTDRDKPAPCLFVYNHFAERHLDDTAVCTLMTPSVAQKVSVLKNAIRPKCVLPKDGAPRKLMAYTKFLMRSKGGTSTLARTTLNRMTLS